MADYTFIVLIFVLVVIGVFWLLLMKMVLDRSRHGHGYWKCDCGSWWTTLDNQCSGCGKKQEETKNRKKL